MLTSLNVRRLQESTARERVHCSIARGSDVQYRWSETLCGESGGEHVMDDGPTAEAQAAK